MVEQARSIDYRSRNAKLIEERNEELLIALNSGYLHILMQSIISPLFTIIEYFMINVTKHFTLLMIFHQDDVCR